MFLRNALQMGRSLADGKMIEQDVLAELGAPALKKRLEHLPLHAEVHKIQHLFANLIREVME